MSVPTQEQALSSFATNPAATAVRLDPSNQIDRFLIPYAADPGAFERDLPKTAAQDALLRGLQSPRPGEASRKMAHTYVGLVAVIARQYVEGQEYGRGARNGTKAEPNDATVTSRDLLISGLEAVQQAGLKHEVGGPISFTDVAVGAVASRLSERTGKPIPNLLEAEPGGRSPLGKIIQFVEELEGSAARKKSSRRTTSKTKNTAPSEPTGDFDSLSKRQMEMAKLAHLPAKLVAEKFVITVKTVKYHLGFARKKLGFKDSNPVTFALYLYEHGIIDDADVQECKKPLNEMLGTDELAILPHLDQLQKTIGRRTKLSQPDVSSTLQSAKEKSGARSTEELALMARRDAKHEEAAKRLRTVEPEAASEQQAA
jgi:DNA-binding CsgD family transcriptional regulator